MGARRRACSLGDVCGHPRGCASSGIYVGTCRGCRKTMACLMDRTAERRVVWGTRVDAGHGGEGGRDWSRKSLLSRERK